MTVERTKLQSYSLSSRPSNLVDENASILSFGKNVDKKVDILTFGKNVYKKVDILTFGKKTSDIGKPEVGKSKVDILTFGKKPDIGKLEVGKSKVDILTFGKKSDFPKSKVDILTFGRRVSLHSALKSENVEMQRPIIKAIATSTASNMLVKEVAETLLVATDPTVSPSVMHSAMVTLDGMYTRMKDWMVVNRPVILKTCLFLTVATALSSLAAMYTTGNVSLFGLLNLMGTIGAQDVMGYMLTSSSLGLSSLVKSLIISTMSTHTVGTILSVAKKNARLKSILEKERIPPQFIQSVFSKFGTDISTTSYESILASVTTYGVTAITSNLVDLEWGKLLTPDYMKFVTINNVSISGIANRIIGGHAVTLGATAITKLPSVVKKGVTALSRKKESEKGELKKELAIVGEVREIRRSVGESLVNPFAESMEDRLSTIADERTESSISDLSIDTKTLWLTRRGAALAATGIASTIIAASAMTSSPLHFTSMIKGTLSGLISTESIAIITSNAVNYLKESSLSKTVLTLSLIKGLGIDRLTTYLGRFVSKTEIAEMKTIEQALKYEQNRSTIESLSDRFITVLKGRMYYTASTLSSMTEENLSRIVKTRKLELGTAEEMKLRIVNDQNERINVISRMQTTAVTAITQAVIHSAVNDMVTHGVDYASTKLDEYKVLLDERNLAAEQQRLKESLESSSNRERALKTEKQLRDVEAQRLRKMQPRPVNELKENKVKEAEIKHKQALERLKLRQALKTKVESGKTLYATDTGVISDVIPEVIPEVIPDVIPEVIPEVMTANLPTEADILNTMKDMKYTRLVDYLGRRVVAAGLTTVPVIGQINGYFEMGNLAIETAVTIDKINAVSGIIHGLSHITQDGAMGEIATGINKLGVHADKSWSNLASYRLPTVNNIAEYMFPLEEDSVHQLVGNVIAHTAKSAIGEGMSAMDTSWELAKGLAFGSKWVGADIVEIVREYPHLTAEMITSIIETAKPSTTNFIDVISKTPSAHPLANPVVQSISEQVDVKSIGDLLSVSDRVGSYFSPEKIGGYLSSQIDVLSKVSIPDMNASETLISAAESIASKFSGVLNLSALWT